MLKNPMSQPPTTLQGIMASDEETVQAQRTAFAERARSAFKAVLEHFPYDSTADQMAARFLRQRLPPPAAASQVLTRYMAVHAHSAIH